VWDGQDVRQFWFFRKSRKQSGHANETTSSKAQTSPRSKSTWPAIRSKLFQGQRRGSYHRFGCLTLSNVEMVQRGCGTCGERKDSHPGAVLYGVCWFNWLPLKTPSMRTNLCNLKSEKAKKQEQDDERDNVKRGIFCSIVRVYQLNKLTSEYLLYGRVEL
jgi:hypothetical protein